MPKFALAYPYFILMVCLVVAVVGVATVSRMPVDLFPEIKIPVVVVATFYSGMPPQQIEADITNTFERFFTLGSNIDHIASRSLTGVSLIKIYFKPGTDANAALSNIANLAMADLRRLPPGTLPPVVLKFDASSLPVCLVTLKGQVDTMRSSYAGLLGGLVFSIVLVYLLIVVNFQSWTDPFIIITALPAALAGIVLFLFLTRTTLSVPALMGAIMCMGVATANSILVVSFAKIRLDEHGNAVRAAVEAGITRFRPVIMTALAMIIGMVPMALGLGDGGEQNAPLGRAVIGGLLCATVATLLFVPSVFALIHGTEKSELARMEKRLVEEHV